MHNNVILLNLESLIKYLYPESKHFSLQIFHSTDSTNSFLINLLKNDKQTLDSTNLIYVVAAEMQTKGRGRNGRVWHSGFGESLTFSLSWNFNEYSVSQLSSLSLVVGVAIIRVLKYFSIKDANLKWPNDVLVNHSKIAGVLIESHSGMKKSCQTVIGIGINCSLSKNTKAYINNSVTDLFEITGKLLDRNLILSALLIEIKKTISNFEMFGFSYFKKEWISYHAYEGKKICLRIPNNQTIHGIVDGVNDHGAICLLTDSGRKVFAIGEISLRDIN